MDATLNDFEYLAFVIWNKPNISSGCAYCSCAYEQYIHVYKFMYVHVYKFPFTMSLLGHQTLSSMKFKYNIISEVVSNYKVQQKPAIL